MRVRVSSLFASGILVVATVAAGAQTITTQFKLSRDRSKALRPIRF